MFQNILKHLNFSSCNNNNVLRFFYIQSINILQKVDKNNKIIGTCKFKVRCNQNNNLYIIQFHFY